MDLAPPRGTQDFVPPRSDDLFALRRLAARQAELFGYRAVETPALEATEVFARTSGGSSDVVRKEMYTFEDRGGRSLTLRPEGTASVVRAYLANSHDLPSPFKAYYLEPMWRYGRPQAGRYREFHQFGIEVIGVAAPAADAEVIVVGAAFLREAGLHEVRLELNSIGDDVCRPPYRDELIAFFRANRERLRDEHRDRIEENPLRILDCKDEACRAVAAEAPRISDRLCDACREHFDEVRRSLDRAGVSFELVHTLVRGLDYYTRTAFEFVAASLSEGQGTVCGGGRYDGLAEVLGGPSTPGVGFAAGLDRILVALENQGGEVPGRAEIDCFVVAVGEAATEVASDVAGSLRSAGVPTLLALEPRPLKAQLRMADRSGARFAAVIGDREAAAGTVTLRRLDDGTQREVRVDELVASLLSAEGRKR